MHSNACTVGGKMHSNACTVGGEMHSNACTVRGEMHSNACTVGGEMSGIFRLGRYIYSKVFSEKHVFPSFVQMFPYFVFLSVWKLAFLWVIFLFKK